MLVEDRTPPEEFQDLIQYSAKNLSIIPRHDPTEEYLSQMLARFSRMEAVSSEASLPGSLSPKGDLSLFLSGFFAPHFKANPPLLRQYISEGKGSYARQVFELETLLRDPLILEGLKEGFYVQLRICEILAHQFEDYRTVLDDVRLHIKSRQGPSERLLLLREWVDNPRTLHYLVKIRMLPPDLMESEHPK